MKIFKKVVSIVIVGVLSVNCLSNYTSLFAEEPYDISMWNYRGSNEVNTIFADEVCDILGVDNIEEITKDDLIRVNELDLRGKGLVEIPYVINLFPNLDTLIVDDNEIPYLHRDISDTLLDLDYFSICNNYLIDVDDKLYKEFGIDSFKYNILDKEYQYSIEVDPSIDIDYLTAMGENGEEYLRNTTELVLLDTNDGYSYDRTTSSILEVYNIEPVKKKQIPELFDIKVREVDVDDRKIIDYFGINERMISEYTSLYALDSQERGLDGIVQRFRNSHRGLEVYLEIDTYEVVSIQSEVIGINNWGSLTTPQAIEVDRPVTTSSALQVDIPVTLPLEYEADDIREEVEITRDILNSEPTTIEEEVEEHVPVTLPLEWEESLDEPVLTIQKEQHNNVTTPQAIEVVPSVSSNTSYDIQQNIPKIKYSLNTVHNTVNSQSSLVFATLNSSDTIPPVVLGIIQSTNEWTSQPVNITVDAQDYGLGSDGSVLVSFDGGTFSSNRSLTVTENRTVLIKVKDKVGNEVSLNYSVKNIDKDKPLAPNVKVYIKDTGKPVSEHINAKGWVNKIVTVEALNREEARGGETQSPIDYMFIQLSDGTRLQENDIDRKYIENLNGTISCGYVDKAGNVSSLTPIGSFKIDTEKPKILNHNSISGTDIKTGYWYLNDYSDNMSDTLELSIDNGNTWEPITRPNKITKSFIQSTQLNIYLRDLAGNLSDKLDRTINADGVKPILTGYRLEPSTWTNGTVKIYPVGDHTGSSWWLKQLNGVNYDCWTNVGFIPVTYNFSNYPMKFSDRASNWADETVYVTVSNIDKDLPYLDSIEVLDNGNGTCDVIINGKDDLSGIHDTQGYSINGGAYSSNNKINIPKSNTDTTVSYIIQDRATNKYSGSVVINNGVALGAPAIATTDRVFEKWGNKDHTISISGGYSPNGISHYEYRIKTIRNGLGETVNTYSNWTKYTQPFVISQEGELELETRIVPKTGTSYVYGSEKVWIDKTKPVAPTVEQWYYVNGVKYPYIATSVPIKFSISAYPLNFYEADCLSGIELITTRVFNSSPVGYKYYKPINYTFSNQGGNNYFYYFDKAGNCSSGKYLGNNGLSYKPYLLSMKNSTNSITDTPISVEVTLRDDYYSGFHAKPISQLYSKLPYDASYLNRQIDSADYIEWYNVSPNANTHAVGIITNTFTVSKNGTYYYYARDRDDLVTSFSFTIDDIDLENPKITSVNVSNTKPTKDSVTVTVNATDDCHSELLQYSFDGGITYASTNSIVVSANQDVNIRVKDGFNRVTSYPTININNIDKEKPVMKSIDTQRVNATDVRLKIVAEDVGTSGLEDKFIAYNDGEWGTSLEFIAKYNVATKISIRDKAGNISETFISVNNENAVMIVPMISSSIASGSWVNDTVIIKVDGGVMPSGLKGYEYRINNESWQTYNVGTGIELSKDGKYEVRARALGLGGEVGAESNPYIINIDKTAPTFNVNLSNSNWTNQNVDLVIKDVSDGNGIGLHATPYSFDGTNWISSEKFTVSESKLYYIKVRDALGNVSSLKTVTVNNIDKVKPTISGIVSAKFDDGTDFEYQKGAWTNKPVTVIFNATDDSSGIDYSEYASSLNSGGWTRTTTPTKLIYNNVSVPLKFRTIDKAGNVSNEYTAPLIKVDTSTPTIKSISGYGEPWYKTTTLVVTGGIVSDAYAPITHYSFDGGSTWQTSNTKLIDKTGTYSIKVKNEAGTSSEATEVKINIDSTAPTITSVTGNPTEWQYDDVTLTVNASDTQSGIKEYSFDNGKTWQTSNSKVFSRNTLVQIKVKDKVGNISSVTTVNITKIDKDAPVINGIKSVKYEDGTDFDYTSGEYASKPVYVTFDITENGSGLAKLLYNGSSVASRTNMLQYTNVGNGTLTFKSIDKVGNESELYTAPLIKVDSITPVINSVTCVNSTDWYNNPKVTVNATTKGVTGIKEFSCDGGKTWQSSSVFTLDKNGINKYDFIAKSGTGNLSNTVSLTVKVDNKAPNKPKINLKGKQFEDLTFNITDILDSDSGVAKTEYKIGNSEWKTYTSGDIAVNSVEPNLVIQVKVTDKVGNFIETQQTFNINLLDVAVPLSIPLEINSNTNVHTTYLNVQNNGTPIDIELSIDDSNGIPLVKESITSWNELSSEETLKKAQMLLSVKSGSELLYDGYLDNQIVVNGNYSLGSLKNGLVKYQIELFTGSSWNTDMSKSYKLNFKVTSKYQ